MEVDMNSNHFLDAENFQDYQFFQLNGQRIIRHMNTTAPAIQERGLEIIVKNIPHQCDESRLFVLFSQAGVIYEMRLMVSHDDRCRGSAFIRYCNRNQCKLAVSLFNGYRLIYKTLVVEESRESHEIAFTGIPSSVSLTGIENFFKAKYSDVVGVKVLSNNSEGSTLKVEVSFSCHRSAALVRREFTSRKMTFWNSYITAEWSETTRKQEIKREFVPKLDLTKWEGVDDEILTDEFWKRVSDMLYEKHINPQADLGGQRKPKLNYGNV